MGAKSFCTLGCTFENFLWGVKVGHGRKLNFNPWDQFSSGKNQSGPSVINENSRIFCQQFSLHAKKTPTSAPKKLNDPNFNILPAL